ncbi:LLM class flavin-dependent oxidoreductase [Luteimicrobium subarcticum]|uniref:Alkanesulfonate monooxygenase SsuD/methylene tetrahydromethanopterin reductase-like flavin-dependent oxidoreductase (Luciferase family) n=1 Tax=Luteimicrobium subarcticum TaxID=620910 RepID=A0A2M8WSC9_9MICO|nr:LLM class flavin-dependent oxidoreductase [Luteimicrobium subarcticum]PJI93823.1 alkanesulfonate monooxygenase SsuD/methylene tetrahydromethanopterin reductase-like flavin-dependent oxidoreductase (luciferase family) [Luteimicrobium subarcticum]
MAAIFGLDLIDATPGADPEQISARLQEVVRNAVLFEDLGFDGFAVGERHHAPFVSSSPPVVLSHIAARTSRIRLLTGVTLLSVLDPVRVAEDYATLDHLSGGRLEIILGKGNGPEQAELFGIGRTEAWDTLEENYRLLRRLWSGEPVTWDPPEGLPTIRRTPLRDATVFPPPLQRRIRVWHGSATAERSVELAAEYGDPIFSANGFNPVEYYARLVRHYRSAWEARGRDPERALVGAGHGAVHVARRSQDAVEAYRPVYEALAERLRAADNHHLAGTATLYDSYEDYLERGSALVGSPQQVLDKVLRYHEAFGNSAITVGGHDPGVGGSAWRDSLELFASDVAPEVRRLLPDLPTPDESADVAAAVPVAA